MSLKSLLAKLILGMALFRRLCWPFGQKKRQQRWLEQISREEHMPSSAHSWQWHAQTSNCMGCGQCDHLPWALPWSPSTWLQQFARMPHLVVIHPEIVDALARQADHIESICPASVQVSLLVQLLQEQQKTTFASLIQPVPFVAAKNKSSNPGLPVQEHL